MKHKKQNVFSRALLDFTIKKHPVRCVVWCICIVLFIVAGAMGDGLASGLIGGLAAIPFIMITWFSLLTEQQARKEIAASSDLVYLLTRKEEKAMRARMRRFNFMRDPRAIPCLKKLLPGDRGLITDRGASKDPLSNDTCSCVKDGNYFACRCIPESCAEPWVLYEDCPAAARERGSIVIGGPYAIENLVVRTGNRRDGILAILYYYGSKLPGELLLAVADHFYDEERNAIKANVLTALRYMARYSDAYEENTVAHIGFLLEVAKGGVVLDYILRLFPYLRDLYKSADFYRRDALEMCYTSTVLTAAAQYVYDHLEEKPEIDFADLFLADGTLKRSGVNEEDSGDDTIYALTQAWNAKYHFLPDVRS